MAMTSLKIQTELLKNLLTFSIDLSQGCGLLRICQELLSDFSFGTHFLMFFYVPLITLSLTLAISAAGA